MLRVVIDNVEKVHDFEDQSELYTGDVVIFEDEKEAVYFPEIGFLVIDDKCTVLGMESDDKDTVFLEGFDDRIRDKQRGFIDYLRSLSGKEDGFSRIFQGNEYRAEYKTLSDFAHKSGKKKLLITYKTDEEYHHVMEDLEF